MTSAFAAQMRWLRRLSTALWYRIPLGRLQKIPAWIMEGYGTMASEAAEQLKKAGVDRPTHISYRLV